MSFHHLLRLGPFPAAYGMAMMAAAALRPSVRNML
jgi:hypothetical protein